MRKLLLMMLCVAGFVGFTAVPAAAQGQGGPPDGNPACETPAGAHNPFCGDRVLPACENDRGKAQERNPFCGVRELPACDGPAGERNPHCTGTLPPGGGNGEEPQPPAGACEGADLVLVPDVATIVCLFQPGNENATEENCPGGIFLGDSETGAICVLPGTQTAASRR